jgi:hypothetical protein
MNVKICKGTRASAKAYADGVDSGKIQPWPEMRMPEKLGLVTVNGVTRLVACEPDGKIRVRLDALRRAFGVPDGAPLIIG